MDVTISPYSNESFLMEILTKPLEFKCCFTEMLTKPKEFFCFYIRSVRHSFEKSLKTSCEASSRTSFL